MSSERSAPSERSSADDSTPLCGPDDVYLGYTNNDDGVHLFCYRCSWDLNLGFDAGVSEATLAAEAHYDRPEGP